MISVEHMDELIVRFNSGEIDIRDVIEQSYIEGRVEAIDDYNRELKDYLRRSDVHYVSDNVFNYFAERLKEQNIK